MKFFIFIMITGFGIQSLWAQENLDSKLDASEYLQGCENGDMTQPKVGKRIDDEFVEKYQNKNRYAHIFCRETHNCYRAKSVTTALYGGDPDRGHEGKEITEVVCTDDKNFGFISRTLDTVSPFENLRTSFFDLKDSKELPRLKHPDGRDLEQGAFGGADTGTPANFRPVPPPALPSKKSGAID